MHEKFYEKKAKFDTYLCIQWLMSAELPANMNKEASLPVFFTQDGQAIYVGEEPLVESQSLIARQESDTLVLYKIGEDQEEEIDVLDTSDPRDSTASPEELNDEETGSGDNESVSKTCTYEGCTATTTQSAKQRKPWMCKKHRNKMYKDKYKKKKNDQAMGSTGKLEDNSEGSVTVTKQRPGSVGERPARPTLLEQVLNQKRLSLLRSPAVIQFLQQQQRMLSEQACAQRQQFQGDAM
ncbi:regulatory factor X-associated protein [Latimeria chalumnae]|uniref:regulatory factor X-associated protein n=1 Tax=Latimeria chalumnae TaxID=7897 RepID=UPI0006D907FB|nr:PREDICTED: regulatory factor X-associated protein isoform X2 [Latimeria chalumnae]|eukprot:XP_014349514.1 PREDICTED: regulatory factor X-associated protein isoform X2 [Latimeria chalumnae]